MIKPPNTPNGRPPLEIDLNLARALLADNTICCVARILMVHRNTLAKHLNRPQPYNYALWSEQKERKRKQEERKQQRAAAMTACAVIIQDSLLFQRRMGRPKIKIDQEVIKAALATPVNSRSHLARQLGIHRNTLYDRLKSDVNLADFVRRGLVLPAGYRKPRRIEAPLYLPDVEVESLSPDELTRVVERAIPRNLTPDLREEFRQELIVALLGKELELSNLLRELPLRLSRFKRQYHTAYLSLDAKLRRCRSLGCRPSDGIVRDERTTLGDTIAAHYR